MCKRGKEKRAIASLITIVLSISIIIVLILILYNMVFFITKGKSEEISQSVEKLMLSNLEVVNWEKNGSAINITIHASAGEGNIERVKFEIITNEEICYVEKDLQIQELETKTTGIFSDCSGSIEEINVYAIPSESAFVGSCSDLSETGRTYYLNSSILNADNKCINIKSENITFDCQGNEIKGDGIIGIYSNKPGTIIKNCIVSMHPTKGRGIELENADYSQVYNNIVSNQRYGIRLVSGTEHAIIKNNTANNNYASGIHVYKSDYNSIIDNIGSFNNAKGIWLENSDYNLIKNNEFNFNKVNGGISLVKSDYNEIKENILSWEKQGKRNLYQKFK